MVLWRGEGFGWIERGDRMMVGAMRSTPISAIETVTGLQPLEDRQEIKILTQAAKFKRLQDHPMHERMNQPTSGRLNRSNFLQRSRILEHLLQRCRLHDALRRDMWPELTLLRDKLYGNLEELNRTTTFLRATGISV